jgi:thymidine phosphorylase
MEQPLGRSVGCGLETAEAIDVLMGSGPKDTVELTVELGAEMLVLGCRASTLAHGRRWMAGVLSDGRALDKFRKMVEAQGGDPRVCDDPKRLVTAGRVEVVKARRRGFVASIHPRKVALAALEVGAGRKVVEDAIDHAAGVVLLVDVGDEVEKGQPLAELHMNRDKADYALSLLNSAFEISADPPLPRKLIIKRI